MNLSEFSRHCEKAWDNYAKQHNIHRDDEFYFLKLQEELGELCRSFLESRGSEFKSKKDLKKKFAGDCASVIGNALILALHFNVDIEKELIEKFPVK